MTRRGLLLGCLPLLLGCSGDPVVFVDARRDLGLDVLDLGPGDAGGGGGDGGVDHGCAPELAEYDPADTMGPDGESLAACEARRPNERAARLPMNQAYRIAALPPSSPPVTTSCGTSSAAGDYVALSPRFPCGQRLRVVNRDRTACRIVEALAEGPHICLEERAEDAVVEASQEVAAAVVSSGSVQVADGVMVFVAPVGGANPLGPCEPTNDSSSALAGFIGGPCNVDADCTFAGGRCQMDGFPGGHCTRDCISSCPDAAGPNAFTACAAPDGAAVCHARCDFTLFDTGCRSGYGCVAEADPSGGDDRDVCVPFACP